MQARLVRESVHAAAFDSRRCCARRAAARPDVAARSPERRMTPTPSGPSQKSIPRCLRIPHAVPALPDPRTSSKPPAPRRDAARRAAAGLQLGSESIGAGTSLGHFRLRGCEDERLFGCKAGRLLQQLKGPRHILELGCNAVSRKHGNAIATCVVTRKPHACSAGGCGPQTPRNRKYPRE